MFSVVIPFYNKAHTIKRTLDTVLNQTFSDFEVIIVNDGSTDNGVDVINQSTKDQRIHIIEQQNQGVSAARNNGVLYAKHKYIAFLDGDDEWKPDYLAIMKEAIDLFPNAGMYCCAGIVRNADGSEFLRLAKKYKGRILEIDFFENPHVFLHTSSTIVLKSEFNKTGGFPYGMKRNEDYAMFFSLALITSVIYAGFPLSIYVGGVQGQATSNNSKEIQEHIINRFNYTFRNWTKLGCSNSRFRIFMKYELRHYFMGSLKIKDYETLNMFFNKLDPGITNLFSPVELFIMKKKNLNLLSIIVILSSKIVWRIHCFPRFSES